MSTNRVEKLRAPKGKCRGCGGDVKPPRRTWCSQKCVDDAAIKTSSSEQRRQTYMRDHGVCALCGFDADKAHRILNHVRFGRNGVINKYGAIDQDRDGFLLLLDLWAPRKHSRGNMWWCWDVPHLWEADHIVAVSEGGGGCTLDNLRTLCIPCHRAETRALHKRLAAARKAAKEVA